MAMDMGIRIRITHITHITITVITGTTAGREFGFLGSTGDGEADGMVDRWVGMADGEVDGTGAGVAVGTVAAVDGMGTADVERKFRF